MMQASPLFLLSLGIIAAAILCWTFRRRSRALRVASMILAAVGSMTAATALGVGGARMFKATSAPAPVQQRTTDSVPTSRGQMLYENHCTVCHESVIHVRKDHRATSAAAVENWVRNWAGEEKLDWTQEEISEVTDYLVNRYYNFGVLMRPAN